MKPAKEKKGKPLQEKKRLPLVTRLAWTLLKMAENQGKKKEVHRGSPSFVETQPFYRPPRPPRLNLVSEETKLAQLRLYEYHCGKDTTG